MGTIATVIGRSLAAILVASPIIASACSHSPYGPDDTNAFVEGQTAHFDEVSVTLEQFNFSWFPRDDSPRPGLGKVFVVVFVGIRNESANIRMVDLNSFRLRTLLGGQGGVGPLWSLSIIGRTPTLEGLSLASGQEIEGWLTFVVPQSEIADELVWMPQRDVVLGIPFPAGHPNMRVARALVFGRVSDPTGAPVREARVEVTTVFPSLEADTPIGNCRGFAATTWTMQTDADGWYETAVGAVAQEKVCIDVQVFPSPSSGLSYLRFGGDEVFLSGLGPGEELPEVRIDAVLAQS